MKAITKNRRGEGLWLEDVPLPTIKQNDVLIKIKKTAICGTDVHIYKWDDWAQKTLPVPLVIGHEFMGEIVEVGSEVKDLKVGDRVSGEGHLVCETCPPCKTGRKHLCINTIGVGVNCQGCFAEFFALPATNVFVLPEYIPDEVAAILDPLGNAVHTALSFELIGEDVLITGAGPIGLMAVAIAKKAGAHKIIITDLNESRLKLSRELGATAAVNPMKEDLTQTMRQHGIPHGFTVAMEMSGAPQALDTILETAMNGAKIALLGILPSGAGIDWETVIFKMLILKGIHGREIFSTWFKTAHLIESGLDLSPIITHRFKADEFQKGFEVMLSGQSGKVILEWE